MKKKYVKLFEEWSPNIPFDKTKLEIDDKYVSYTEGDVEYTGVLDMVSTYRATGGRASDNQLMANGVEWDDDAPECWEEIDNYVKMNEEFEMETQSNLNESGGGYDFLLDNEELQPYIEDLISLASKVTFSYGAIVSVLPEYNRDTIFTHIIYGDDYKSALIDFFETDESSGLNFDDFNIPSNVKIQYEARF